VKRQWAAFPLLFLALAHLPEFPQELWSTNYIPPASIKSCKARSEMESGPSVNGLHGHRYVKGFRYRAPTPVKRVSEEGWVEKLG